MKSLPVIPDTEQGTVFREDVNPGRRMVVQCKVSAAQAPQSCHAPGRELACTRRAVTVKVYREIPPPDTVWRSRPYGLFPAFTQRLEQQARTSRLWDVKQTVREGTERYTQTAGLYDEIKHAWGRWDTDDDVRVRCKGGQQNGNVKLATGYDQYIRMKLLHSLIEIATAFGRPAETWDFVLFDRKVVICKISGMSTVNTAGERKYAP